MGFVCLHLSAVIKPTQANPSLSELGGRAGAEPAGGRAEVPRGRRGNWIFVLGVGRHCAPLHVNLHQFEQAKEAQRLLAGGC